MTLTAAPPEGVWRLGWAHNPVEYNRVEPDTFEGSAAGLYSLYSYSTLYCASTPAGCYAEALATYRIGPKIRELMGNAGLNKPHLMAMGHIPSSWREERILVRLIPAGRTQFLDIETEETRAVLASDLKEELSAFGVTGQLADNVLHGPDRRITRQIAAWAVAQRNADGHHLVQGITFRSGYGGRRCWAILGDTGLTEVERCAIRVEDVALQEVASEYGLTVR
ncbi:RES domain-containing protein [Streptomyces sp. NBC_00038]|uniref:RES domain-containing protein n=1 Tax=Streptomyces sp. NBC_00038 TaxID=2903615 RepID=UPI002254A24C|nr:RES domain-containing protein [Streptomyces sp. NBC_00038]MCX5559497.1 RES domain-containing protein [Streptomyces sp. NBC_00038]